VKQSNKEQSMNEIIDILDELDITITIEEAIEAIEETPEPEDMFNLLLDNILEISYQKNNQK
jgi:hypothetical protein